MYVRVCLGGTHSTWWGSSVLMAGVCDVLVCVLLGGCWLSISMLPSVLATLHHLRVPATAAMMCRSCM